MPEKGCWGSADRSATFFRGGRSSEQRRRGLVLPGAGRRRLQTRGESNQRLAYRRGILRSPECCWGSCGSRGMARSVFRSLARRGEVSVELAGEDGSAAELTRRGRRGNPKLMAGKAEGEEN